MTASPTVRLPVELGQRAYDILIGPGLLSQSFAFAGAPAGQAVLIVTDSTIAPLYRQPLEQSLTELGHTVDTLVLPPGEGQKSLTSLEIILDHLLENGYGRDATLVALGGGVIGDLTGFAAAIYQRGIAFIQVPTTLLAQVDSSVGGKTGINHALGKNMIGAFLQPRRVIIDTRVLISLPRREFAAGMAEVIKYGLIRDTGFFDWLETHMAAIMAGQSAQLIETIRRSCANKAAVVQADEFEAGQRALLNLGHTYGHALEAELGYGTWLHGEAVAAGMVMAADTSQRLGWLDQSQCQRIIKLLQAADLPTAPPSDLSIRQIKTHMQRDKKVSAGTIRLILLTDIGQALSSRDYGQAMAQTLQHYLAP